MHLANLLVKPQKCLNGLVNHYYEAKTWEVNNSKFTYWPNVFALELRMAECLEALGHNEDAEEVRRRIKALSDSLGQAPEMP